MKEYPSEIQELAKKITALTETMGQEKMAAKFGVSRHKIRTALQCIIDRPEEPIQDKTAEITTTENCVCVSPTDGAPVAVGNVYYWGKGGSVQGMVTFVSPETKTIGIWVTRPGQGSTPPTSSLETVDFKNWKKRKAEYSRTDHAFILGQTRAKEKGAWDGSVENSWGFGNVCWSDGVEPEDTNISVNRNEINKDSTVVVEDQKLSKKEKKEIVKAGGECPFQLIASSRSISITTKSGDVYSITKDEIQKYQKAIDAIQAKDWPLLRTLCEQRIQYAIEYKKLLDSEVGIAFRDGKVLVKDKETAINGMDIIHKRFQKLSEEGEVDAIVILGKFVKKLSENPDPNVRNRIVEFMKFADVELNHDGDIIAYKVVRGNYYDKHSGKILNRPGSIPMMKRSDVDSDERRQCSSGLHVCSLSYSFSFWGDGDRLMKVRLSPTDIVSIPRDYSGAKIRCAKYVVLEDVTDQFLNREIAADFKGYFA